MLAHFPPLSSALERTKMMRGYELFEHKHKFSVWAAARATQRGFTNVNNLREALENCGVIEFIKDPASFEINENEFRNCHTVWCNQIIDYLTRKGVKNSTFGRAAKLIAVYLKSMVIVGGAAQCNLAKIAHPPIDRILLQNISEEFRNSIFRENWKKTNWTQLNEKEYYRLIDQLTSCLEDGEPMWKLEKFWTVTNE